MNKFDAFELLNEAAFLAIKNGLTNLTMDDYYAAVEALNEALEDEND